MWSKFFMIFLLILSTGSQILTLALENNNYDTPSGIKIGVVFTHPKIRKTSTLSEIKLPANYPVKFEVVFINEGTQDFKLNTIHASFRSTLNNGNYLQNFSSVEYNKISSTKDNDKQKRLEYIFRPSSLLLESEEVYLNIVLNYQLDLVHGQQFKRIFMWKCPIIELKEGLKGFEIFTEYTEKEILQKFGMKKYAMSSLDADINFINKDAYIQNNTLQLKSGAAKFEISFENTRQKNFVLLGLQVSVRNPENIKEVYKFYKPILFKNDNKIKPNQRVIKLYTFSPTDYSGYKIQLVFECIYRSSYEHTEFSKSDIFYKTLFSETVTIEDVSLSYSTYLLMVLSVLAFTAIIHYFTG